MRALAIWAGLALVLAWPVAVAAHSPLLEWRGPVYVAAGFAGIAGLVLIVLQPLLAAGMLPGPTLRTARRVHAALGAALVAAVLLHVSGLWITSPPDVIDALTFTSPTPFSAWGVIAMWAVFAAAALAALRRRVRPALFRAGHTGLVILVAVCTVPHALLIEGTMGPVSKAALCALALGAVAVAVVRLKSWVPLRRLWRGEGQAVRRTR